MARQVLVLALIFLAVVGAAMAGNAPSESPKSSKSSTAPSSSPKASPAASPKASPAASPKASASGSPAPSPAPSTEDEISSPPAPGSEYSDAVDFGAPSPAPVAADLFPAADQAAPPANQPSGASALKVSAAVAALAGFFAILS